MASIEELLVEMEDILDDGKSVAFSSNKKTVDAEALRTVIEDLRLNVPEEVKQAKILASERREIMSRANQEYETTVEESKIISRDLLAAAERRAKDMDAETNRRTEELMRITQKKAQTELNAARREANRIISKENIVLEAQQRAAQIKAEADEYYEQVKAEAAEYIENAKAKAQRIVDDTEYTCEEKMAASEKWAYDLKLNASKYVDEIVNEAEYRISKSYGEIKKLQENLDFAAGKTKKAKKEMDRNRPGKAQVASGAQRKKSKVVEDDDLEIISHQSVIDIPLDEDIFSNSFDDPPLHERPNYNIKL